MNSPLEKQPKLLEKIGLFIVLFNLIDNRLNFEFYFLLNQKDLHERPLIDFLSSQRFSQKLDLLKISIGDILYKEIKEINDFRNFIAHGTYGEEVVFTESGATVPSGKVSVTKLGSKAKYQSCDLNEQIISEYIEKERQVLKSMHELIVSRLPSITST